MSISINWVFVFWIPRQENLAFQTDVARLLAPTSSPSLQSSTTLVSSKADLGLRGRHGAAEEHDDDLGRSPEGDEGSQVHCGASGRLHHPLLRRSQLWISRRLRRAQTVCVRVHRLGWHCYSNSQTGADHLIFGIINHRCRLLCGQTAVTIYKPAKRWTETGLLWRFRNIKLLPFYLFF